MGGLCSKVSAVVKSPSDTALGRNQVADHEPGASLELEKPPVSQESAAPAKRLDEQQQSFSFLESVVPGVAFHAGANASGEAGSRASPQLTRSLSQRAGVGKAKAGAAKVSEVSSILGRASTVGLEKAVEVLDTLGCSMTSLNSSSGFVSSSAAKGNKISMLAFEVANTIVKGSNLMRSLSEPSIKHLKEVVLHSEGVENLISKDFDELLKMASADKREELEVFTREVVRFGNRCKDPQWHNLDRYFEKLASERTPQSYMREKAESVMQKLVTCVQDTVELYHELHALDRFEHDCRLKQKEKDGLSSRGDNLDILKQELKVQSKHVKSLKKKSLWSKNLEETVKSQKNLPNTIIDWDQQALHCIMLISSIRLTILFLDHVQCPQMQGIRYIIAYHLPSNLLCVLSYNLLKSRKSLQLLGSKQKWRRLCVGLSLLLVTQIGHTMASVGLESGQIQDLN